MNRKQSLSYAVEPVVTFILRVALVAAVVLVMMWPIACWFVLMIGTSDCRYSPSDSACLMDAALTPFAWGGLVLAIAAGMACLVARYWYARRGVRVAYQVWLGRMLDRTVYGAVQ
ncbi:hypothetical protein [Paraburkholderia youngii]|uniref:hypothetical protein n=1 Tax=Paraburkholderia youngii TaxID=2782701 RepID=UPI003D254A8E